MAQEIAARCFRYFATERWECSAKIEIPVDPDGSSSS